MESIRAEQPRNACVLCRSKKVRCLPCETPGVSSCQKCYRNGQECLPPNVKVRQRRKKLVNRIEQLEQNLSSVTAELAAKRSLKESSLLISNGNSHAPPASGSAFSTPSMQAENHSHSKISNEGDVFDQGILSEMHAQALLKEFKFMARNFPYVLVPDLEISHFRKRRPLLLLAILTTSSWRNRPLQIDLEREYLKELGEQMIIKGEQSLDMLQSLLIHLAWRHFHLKSAYRLAASAVSLVVSLGLDIRPSEVRKLGVHFEFNRTFDTSTQSNVRGAEARRAYIGCYVISTSYSLSLRKAGALKYSSYLEECASSLAAENEVRSDLLIVHYLRLVHHTAQIDETFGYGDPERANDITDERLQFYVKYFQTQREELRSIIPPELVNDEMLHASYVLVSAYTLEIGLYNISTTTLSPARMTVLVDCLLSVKRILDMLVALPDQGFQTLMGFNWAKIHYTINLAIELTVGIPSSSWSIESARNIIQLETYIDLFCQRLNEQSPRIHSETGNGDWFQMLSANWTALRRTYLIGLQKKGIQVVDRDVPVVGNENEQMLQLQPEFIHNSTVSYGNVDLSSIDFMFNDWMWVPQDGNMMVAPTL